MPDIQLFLEDRSAFEPEATHAMSVAFDKACQILKIEDTPAREAMAARIIELVRRGERDPEQLCESVLHDANKRSAAHGAEHFLVDLR